MGVASFLEIYVVSQTTYISKKIERTAGNSSKKNYFFLFIFRHNQIKPITKCAMIMVATAYINAFESLIFFMQI